MKQKYCFDFEVFKRYLTITLINVETEAITFFEVEDNNKNQTAEILKFINDNVEVLIGYNNADYDNWILFSLLIGYDPYEVSQFIINDRESNFKIWHFPAFREALKFYNYKVPFITYDLMLDVKSSGDGQGISNLKSLEGAMGESIEESKINWDYPDLFTEEMKAENKEYNIYDTKITLQLFKKFSHGYQVHAKIIEKYWNFDKSNLYRLPKKLSKKAEWILMQQDKKLPTYSKYEYEAPPLVAELLNDDLILLHFQKQFNVGDKVAFEVKHQKQEYIFGSGGLHMAIPALDESGELWHVDFASFYPHIMTNFNMITRAPKNGVTVLKTLMEERLKYKHTDPLLDNGNKLIINIIFGESGNPYSKLYDPAMQASVCYTGQLILFALVKRLSKFAKILNTNTDGLIIKPKDFIKCNEIIDEFASKLGIPLETGKGVRLIQKDVNNYLFLKEDVLLSDWDDRDIIKNKITAKGSYVKFFNEQLHNSNFGGKMVQIKNDYTILNEALAKYLISGIPMEKTIKQSTDLVKFQKIYSRKGAYIETYHGFEKLEGKVQRIFNTKNGTSLSKRKAEGNMERVGNISDFCTIINKKVLDMSIKEVNIDYDFYIDLAYKRLSDFQGG